MNKVERIYLYILIVFGIVLASYWYEVYVPKNFFSEQLMEYKAPKGWGDEEISDELQKLGIIKSNYAFRIYVIFSGNNGKIQAGKYLLSAKMSIAEIVNKMAKGQVMKENITILEGWSLRQVKEYLLDKNICTTEEFSQITNKDFTQEFLFLEDKPKDLSLEGYIFPDTYEISVGENCEQIIKKTLNNFGKKVTQELTLEIIRQKRSVFDIVRIASILEKEVASLKDKKIVAGILNNRLEIGMPLQVDSSINYITGKNDPGALIIDTKIDSLYNTYKYAGLPVGPISNPGLDSIISAIYPTDNNYFYYLSAKDGTTIFSKTLQEHNLARAKYLK